MATRYLLIVGACCLTVTLAAAETSGPAISSMPDGTLAIQGTAEVPSYAAAGRWTEANSRSSARHAVRHFLFMVPNGPPAMELYVSRDLTDEPPDGGFEIGLVSGFLSGFGTKSGFRYDAPVFEDAAVGATRVKRCRVELSKEDRKLWLYAYIFVRQPSLTFLTIRPRADASRDIEGYLQSVRLK